MPEFSHLDSDGNPVMVDVSSKPISTRKAIAATTVILPQLIWEELEKTGLQTRKGSVVQVAMIAGIMAAKKTSELIPLCHPISLTDCKIDIARQQGNELAITCQVTTDGKTGVEMEALVGASIAALTIYDMCKAMSHDIVISETRLIQKSGGKHDYQFNG